MLFYFSGWFSLLKYRAFVHILKCYLHSSRVFKSILKLWSNNLSLYKEDTMAKIDSTLNKWSSSFNMYTNETWFETSRLHLPQCLKIEYKHTPCHPKTHKDQKIFLTIFSVAYSSLLLYFYYVMESSFLNLCVLDCKLIAYISGWFLNIYLSRYRNWVQNSIV